MLQRALIAFGAIVLGNLAGPAAAQTSIAVTGFGYVSVLPVWVAQDRGFFARENLKVTIDQTQGSIAQMRDMMSGKYQIAMTSIDNVIAYTEGQADVKLENFDLVAFMGVHAGLNSVVARPEIKTFADIKGKTVVVDAVSTGYAFLFYRILREAGLRWQQDYSIIGAGGGGERRTMMQAGKAVAAVMSSPEDVRAKNEGYNILADPGNALAGRYEGGDYVVRRSWAANHRKELVAMVKAMRSAHEYIYAEQDGALQILKQHIPNLPDEDARSTFASLVSGRGGLIRNAAISMDGVRTVLSIRNEFATPKKDLNDPTKYVDLSYYNEAIGGMR
jgi:ABC-type nitrate/sulfonate/bicarbonate transport system substrate-binding protein